jgi:DNA-binding NtrC family response regulator
MNFTGRRLLIVEDNYLIAAELAQALTDDGAEIVGPAASVRTALELLEDAEPIDMALLDVRLRGETSFALADVLISRDVPVVFSTGDGASAMPARFEHVPRCDKPTTPTDVARTLLASLTEKPAPH